MKASNPNRIQVCPSAHFSELKLQQQKLNLRCPELDDHEKEDNINLCNERHKHISCVQVIVNETDNLKGVGNGHDRRS